MAPFKPHNSDSMHLTKTLKIKNFLYVNPIKTTSASNIEDKTAKGLQKQRLHYQEEHKAHFYQLNPCFKLLLWYLDLINQQPGEKKDERVCCYRCFYRVFHPGCCLSALAVTALSRIERHQSGTSLSGMTL